MHYNTRPFFRLNFFTTVFRVKSKYYEKVESVILRLRLNVNYT